MSALPHEACWRAQDASAILSNEALEGHEGIFLATHSPIQGFDIAGSHAGEFLNQDEQAVLKALADPAREHAFCVVQGEPGSGKSHLIRWLHVNWPQPSDIKLLLQRADGSLEGALRQLRDRLPPEFAELFNKLGQTHRATVQGRANNFLSNLANALDPGHFDPPLEDVDWCTSHRPGDLVGSINVKRSWNGPARILHLLEGQGSGASGSRNSESASFNVSDMRELANCCADLRTSGLFPATLRLATKLRDEAQIIAAHQNAGWSTAEIERDLKDQLPVSLRLMAALNRRRNDAIQNLLGVSAEGLKTLFRQIRTELARTPGVRLVLLLEDITSWEGIDDSLIDVLVTNARTRSAGGDDAGSDMCPLISVVGVTPAYYQKLHGNYRGRITHEVVLGQTSGATDLQDVATLRDRQARLSFAARYLAATRAGTELLAEWRQQRSSDPTLPVPNRCDGCPVREGCHRTFGADSNGYGYFPFTENALERLFRNLNDRDNGLTWKTPRGILQAILSPNLSQPDALAAQQFPTALLETRALPIESGKLSSRLGNLVEVGASATERPRLQRLLAYWGDRERADTTRLDNGDLAFADVPQGVFEAFGLPWLGDDQATAEEGARLPAEPQGPLLPDEPPVSTDTMVLPLAPAVRPSSPVTRPLQGRIIQVQAPPSKRKAPTKNQLERLRDQLRVWGETGELASPSDWNKILYELVRAVDPRRIGLDPGTFNRLLTQEQVKFEGTGPTQRNYFRVCAADWVRDGLEAYLALRHDNGLSNQDLDYDRRKLSLALRRLEEMVGGYADQRLTHLENGQRWAPAAALGQILLARAWLRGTVAPSDSLSKQVRAILSDEPQAESDPASRCSRWNDFLNRTKDHHANFRNVLREMMSLPQGEARGFGLADLSVIAGAVERLRRTLRFDDVPDVKVDTSVPVFDRARDIIKDTELSLKPIMRYERDQIRGRAEALYAYLRGQSIAAHYARLDRAIVSAAEQLPHAAPDQVRGWKQAYQRLKPKLEAKLDAGVEELLYTLSEAGPGLPPKDVDLFDWVLRAPAKDLDDMRGLADIGERTVAAIVEHVRDCVREAGKAVPLETLRMTGRRIKAALHPTVDSNQTEEPVIG